MFILISWSRKTQKNQGEKQTKSPTKYPTTLPSPVGNFQGKFSTVIARDSFSNACIPR